MIFNKKAIQKYNDEKVIETKLVNKGFTFKAGKEEINLIMSIIEFCEAKRDLLS